MTSSQFRLFVLRNTPHIETIDGESIDLQGVPLDALIFSLIDDNAPHSLDDLNNALYGGNQSDAISSRARNWRYKWRRTFEPYYDGDIVELTPAPDYEQSIVEGLFVVDALEFEQQAATWIDHFNEGNKPNYGDIQALLEMYQDEFLAGYSYKLTALAGRWQQKKQQHFADIHNRLMNTFIRYLIDSHNMQEAYRLAQRWHTFPHAGEMPLQYLILTAHNLQLVTDQDRYLRELEQRTTTTTTSTPYPDFEDSDGIDMMDHLDDIEDYSRIGLHDFDHLDRPTSGIGLTVEQWQRTLKQESDTMLGSWIITHYQNPPVKRFPIVGDIPLVGRYDEISRVMGMLSHDQPLRAVSITGDAGIGKTEVAMTAIHKLESTGLYECIQVDITRETNYEQLITAIVRQMTPPEQPQPATFKQREYFINELQSGRYVLLLDEWEAADAVWDAILPRLLEHLSSSRLIVVRRNTAKISQLHNVILDPLNLQETQSLYIKFVPDHADEPTAWFKELHQVTNGIPALIVMLAQLIKHGSRPIKNYASKQAAAMRSLPTTEDRYRHLWEYIWLSLHDSQKHLLLCLSLFDEYQGAPLQHLYMLMTDYSDQKVREELEHVEAYTLVKVRDHMQHHWYHLKPSLRQYIQQHIIAEHPAYAAIKANFVAHYYEVRHHEAHSAWIKTHYRNVLQAFTHLLASPAEAPGSLPDDFRTTYELLNHLGKYDTIIHYLQQMREIPHLAAKERIRILYQLGQMAIRQGRYDKAETFFMESLADAERSNIMSFYSANLYEMARICLYRSDFDAAHDYLDQAHEAIYGLQEMLPLRCRILLSYASLEEGRAHFDSAARYYEQVRDIVDAHSQKPDTTVTLPTDLIETATTGIGLLALKQEHYTAALHHFQEALRIIDDNGLNSERRYLNLLNIGVAHFYLEQFEASSKFYEQARDIAERTDEPARLIRIRWNQATNFIIRGQQYHDIAERELHLNIQEAHSRDLLELEISNLITLGAFYLRKQLYDRAWHYQMSAYRMAHYNDELRGYALYGLAVHIILREHMLQFPDVQTVTDDLRDVFAAHEITPKPTAALQAALPRARHLYTHLLNNFGNLDCYHIQPALDQWIAMLSPS